MTDDIKNLIAQAREIGNRGYTTDLIHGLVAAVEAKQSEAEHGWSLVYIERANVRIEYERRTAVEAERDALRAENKKLLDKLETAMGVSEENDALHTAIQEATRLLSGCQISPTSRAEWVFGILSRAIDTKDGGA